MPGVLDLDWDFRKATPKNPTPAPGHSSAIYRGDSYEHVLEFWSDTEKTEPFVFTGTFRAQIREERLDQADVEDPSPAPVAVFNCELSGPGPNVVTISLTPEQTLSLPVSGFWDLQEENGERVTTILAGKVKVLDDVTR